ncbi:MAG: hypothetical protein QXX95_03575 [Nitrososphaerales archaeon]
MNKIEDKELERILRKKMIELKKKLEKKEEEHKKEPNYREILLSRLVDKGIEVLERAEEFYPQETAQIVKNLANLIMEDKIKGYISGGELLWLFRYLGLNITMDTKISVYEKGKLVPFAQKIKDKEEDK